MSSTIGKRLGGMLALVVVPLAAFAADERATTTSGESEVGNEENGRR